VDACVSAGVRPLSLYSSFAHRQNSCASSLCMNGSRRFHAVLPSILRSSSLHKAAHHMNNTHMRARAHTCTLARTQAHTMHTHIHALSLHITGFRALQQLAKDCLARGTCRKPARSAKRKHLSYLTCTPIYGIVPLQPCACTIPS